MSLLLDSNAVLWWLLGSDRISRRTRNAVLAQHGPIWVSAISIYELRVKAAKGRLAGLPAELPGLLAGFGFAVMPVTLLHAERAAVLPPHHRDPWDRLLIGQALQEGCAVVTADNMFAAYGVQVIW